MVPTERHQEVGETLHRNVSKFSFIVVLVLFIIVALPISCKISNRKVRIPDSTQPETPPFEHSGTSNVSSSTLKPESTEQFTQKDTNMGATPTKLTVEATSSEIPIIIPSEEESSTNYVTKPTPENGSPNNSCQRNSEFKREEGKLFYTSLPVEKDEKVILITVDDGPGEYTNELLSVLKELDIKVAFFLNGDTVPWYRDVVKRKYEEGHTIGSHTYCHRSYYRLEKTASREKVIETMKNDFIKTETNIKAIIPDIKIRLLRMPEGYYRPWMDPVLKEFGYICVNWTAGYDWIQEPDEKLLEYYKKALRPGGIYLFHDGKTRGKRAMKLIREFVRYAREQGYRIADPKELFGD